MPATKTPLGRELLMRIAFWVFFCVSLMLIGILYRYKKLTKPLGMSTRQLHKEEELVQMLAALRNPQNPQAQPGLLGILGRLLGKKKQGKKGQQEPLSLAYINLVETLDQVAEGRCQMSVDEIAKLVDLAFPDFSLEHPKTLFLVAIKQLQIKVLSKRQ